MKDITFERTSIDFDELDSFEIPVDSLFELCVNMNSTKYEFLINVKPDSDKLIVLGSGALVESVEYDRSKPYYNRWTWKYDDSFICYNDPTLYLDDDLYGGWGIGCEEEYYLENIKDILLKIANKLSVKNKNILFFGSSMGGFMSIQLATMVKQSTALADIPQLNLYTYSDKHWEKLRKHCFSNKSDEYILENYSYRINVCEMMRREKYVPNAVLNLDFSAKYDVDHQFLVFFKEFSELPFPKMEKNYIKIAMACSKGRHEALSNEDTLDLINGVSHKDWMIYFNQIQDSGLYEENKNLKKELDSLVSSNSWKLTSVFRKIFSKFR